MRHAGSVVLPVPPSANRWWRNVGGRMVKSAQARDYQQAAGLIALRHRCKRVAAPEAVRVELTWYRARKSGDLDKRIGVLLDALQGVAFDNDKQITELVAVRRDDAANPRVEVTVYGLEDAA